MNQKIIVELDARWERWINSPVYVIVSMLTGVSITFAPMYLYWFGDRLGTWQVAACFALNSVVPLFYFWLGHAVARSIRKENHIEDKDVIPPIMNRLGRLVGWFRQGR